MDNPWSLNSSPSPHAENRSTFEETGKIRSPGKGHSGPAQPINADPAISHFPPELLSKIFLICAASWPTDELIDRTRYQDNFECADHLPWIAIAQVCRHWRSIALGCGELWKRLVFSSPEATNEMVHRSNGVSLIVQAESFYDRGIYENIRTVISDMRRVSVLHLSFPPHHLQHLLQELSATAPQLESLRLRTPSYSTHRRDILNFDFSGDSFNMPDFIHTPSLRLLELTRCKFSWQPPPSLCGLTHLELRKISPPPTIAQILSFLRGLPMLNTLIIEEALPTLLRDDTSPDNPSPRQLLRNLHALTLCGSVDACSLLLQQICYATATGVALKCDISSRSSPDFCKLLRAAESAATFGGGGHSVQSLFIANQMGCLIFSHPVPTSSNVPQLAIIIGRQSDQRGDFVRSTVIALPITEVQMLSLSGGLSGIDWSEFLHHLPKIHTIHIRHAFPLNFINLLAGDVEQTIRSSKPVTVILPQLRSLWLTGVDFLATGCTPRSFLACLQSRAQLDSAIQDLHIQDSLCLYEREVEMMKEFVQDVDWDGIEQDDPYDYEGGSNDYEGIDNSD